MRLEAKANNDSARLYLKIRFFDMVVFIIASRPSTFIVFDLSEYVFSLAQLIPHSAQLSAHDASLAYVS